MKVTVIDHIGIAVQSIEESLKIWETALGIACTGVEEVEEQKVKTAFLPVGDTEIELLEGTAPDSPVTKFIEKKGEGLHHIAYTVDDIQEAHKSDSELRLFLLKGNDFTGIKPGVFMRPLSDKDQVLRVHAASHR